MQESRDPRITNGGYPRGYHYKSTLFGFLLSLPERVQRAVTFSPPCPLLEKATLCLGLVTGTLLLLTQFVSSFSPPCTGASSGITCAVAAAIFSPWRRCTDLFRKPFCVRTVAVHTRSSRPGRTSVTLASSHFPRDTLSLRPAQYLLLVRKVLLYATCFSRPNDAGTLASNTSNSG